MDIRHDIYMYKNVEVYLDLIMQFIGQNYLSSNVSKKVTKGKGRKVIIRNDVIKKIRKLRKLRKMKT